MFLLQVPNHPFPEIERLRMRVIDAEDSHTLLDPIFDNALQLFPERSPIPRFEFQRVDVLIFLWWILRVLHGSIGAPPEPLGMLLDVRMIRRTLVSDIECNVDPFYFRGGDKVPEIFQCSELRMDCLVAAFLRADAPRTPRVVRSPLGGIVLALAVRFAYRVNWREVEDIEAHSRYFGKDALAVLEGSV